MRTRLISSALSFALAGVAAGTAGCAADFGGDLSARPTPRALSGTDATTLRLPQDESFSIVLPSSSEEAGLGGSVKADASAAKEGRAEASAAVTEAGTARGEFKLGHAFENDTARQVDLNLTISLDFEFATTADQRAALPDARIGLKILAKDLRNRTLRSFDLVQHTTESGPARSESSRKIQFAVTLAPGNVVNVYVA